MKIFKIKLAVWLGVQCLFLSSLCLAQGTITGSGQFRWDFDEGSIRVDGTNKLTSVIGANNDMEMLTVDYSSLWDIKKKYRGGGLNAEVRTGGYVKMRVYSYNEEYGKGEEIYATQLKHTSDGIEQYSLDQPALVNIGQGEHVLVLSGLETTDMLKRAQDKSVYYENDGWPGCEGTSYHSIWTFLPSFWQSPWGCPPLRRQQPVVVEIEIKDATLMRLKIPGLIRNLDNEPWELSPLDLLYHESSYEFAMRKQIFNYPQEYNYTMVAAHRGYWAEAGDAENTIQTFDKAWDLGADLIEIDVRSTSDGVPVCAHDGFLFRLYNTDDQSIHINNTTWDEFKMMYVKDRFGNVTNQHPNSIEEIYNRYGYARIISLDIKDLMHSSAKNPSLPALWSQTFKACLQLAKDRGILDNIIIKGFPVHLQTKEEVEVLLNEVGLEFGDINFTPVMYGGPLWGQVSGRQGAGGTSGGGPSGSSPSGGGGGAATGVNNQSVFDLLGGYVELIENGIIRSIETHFKVNTDPLLASGFMQWLQDRGVRIGIFDFYADNPNGVLEMELDGSFITREYYFNPSYESLQEHDFLNDGRGNLDWVMDQADPDYIIHDRPDMVIDWLSAQEKRRDKKRVIKRLPLPGTVISKDKLSEQQKVDHPGIEEQRTLQNFDGIALHIPDLSKVEITSPNVQFMPVNREIIERGYRLGYTGQWPNMYNSYETSVINAEEDYICEPCNTIYGGMSAVDNKGHSYSDRMKFPMYNLAEWSTLFPGYDVYLNANYWDTRGWPGDGLARDRPEFINPCSDVFGLWISQGEVLSLVEEPTDPTTRTQYGDTGDGRFDVLAFLENGTAQIVKVADFETSFDNFSGLTIGGNLFSSSVKVKTAVSGYVILSDGVPIKTKDATDKFNNDQMEKKRTIVGLRSNTDIIIFTEQGPDLRVGEAAQIMKEVYGCTDAILMDSGRSSAVLTSVGSFPNIKYPTSPGVRAGTTPNGLDTDHLKQYYNLGPFDPIYNVYRPLATFLAIKEIEPEN